VETLKLNAKIETREPQVLLDPTLQPGRYLVQLVVQGAQGVRNPSLAATLVISVVRGPR